MCISRAGDTYLLENPVRKADVLILNSYLRPYVTGSLGKLRLDLTHGAKVVASYLVNL